MLAIGLCRSIKCQQILNLIYPSIKNFNNMRYATIWQCHESIPSSFQYVLANIFLLYWNMMRYSLRDPNHMLTKCLSDVNTSIIILSIVLWESPKQVLLHFCLNSGGRNSDRFTLKDNGTYDIPEKKRWWG